MNLLVLNQKLDASDSDLEVAHEWVRELATRVTSVWVVTHEQGTGAVPANVRVLSIGRERHYGRPRKILEFYRALHRVLRETQIDACFVHMVPVFAVMAAPVLKFRRVPIVQWYTHSATSATLVAASLLVDVLVTASRESLSLGGPKVVATGHGIDTTRFQPALRRRESSPFRILCVGRLSPVKRHDRLIDAVATLRGRGRTVRLTLIGEPHGPHGIAWAGRIRQQIVHLQLQDVVNLAGAVERSALPSWYHDADVCVNLSETNSLDKVVLEAMSCGVPVVTSNPAFAPLLDGVAPRLLLPDSNPETVASAIEAVMSLDRAAAESLGSALRARVVEQHDLRRLMDRLVTLMESLVQARRGGAGALNSRQQ